MNSDFEIVGEIKEIELIALSGQIRELDRLKEQFGGKRWRKLKGVATVKFHHDETRRAEVHWYECHSVGRVKMKVKTFLDEDNTSAKEKTGE